MKFISRLNLVLQSLVVVLAILGLTGCSDSLSTEYGKSRGYAADKNINGFGALRRTFQIRGWSTKDVSRLNDRLSGLNAIVWMPTQRDTLHHDATNWFDEWLSEAPRTLVYIVPDGGCEIEYFEIARSLAPPEQQLEYRRHIARIKTDSMLQRMDQSTIPDNGWFGLERLPDDVKIGGQVGEWNREIKKLHTEKSFATSPILLDYKLVNTSSALAATPPASPSATGGTTPSAPPPQVSPLGRSIGQSSVDVNHETLLTSDDGSTAILRITADEWGDSKIIVVGNGSLLSNFSLATPFGQELAMRLLQETSASVGNVGFMTTDYLGASVSDVDPEINAQSGMELFTVWPMSLILLNLAVIGFVACMVLLPIFGRPRETDLAEPNDFADHIDAVAALMSRSGGEEYARRRVSDYMKRIRGETAGPWVIQEPVHQTVSTFHHPTNPPSPAVETRNREPAVQGVDLFTSPATLSTKEKS